VFSRYAAKNSRADETAVNRITWAGVTSPLGRARMLVLGFSASKTRSAQRLNPMAAERAPTMATAIQKIVRHAGSPRAASSAPVNAKGNAKIVCSNLIISRMIFILFSMSFLKKIYHGDTPQRKSLNPGLRAFTTFASLASWRFKRFI
jgi:hypothetical protein